MIEIDAELSLPEDEIRFTASRGGGPGGQHVNKVASRVTLLFDVERSPSLSASQRSRIREALANRITRDGVLQLTTHATRSQAANRELLVERLRALLADALTERAPRKRTRPGKGARERRLESKRRRAQVKRSRTRPAEE